MAFDPFFRQLDSTKPKMERHALCKCRQPKKGELYIGEKGNLIFQDICSADKACFKIQFDYKQSQKLRTRKVIRDRPRKRKKKDTRQTLDKFLGLPQDPFDS
jgi:hypothetical protein